MATFLRQRFARQRQRGKGSEKNLVGNSRRDPSRVLSDDDFDALTTLKKYATKSGEVFDHYRIDEELGRGAFARVFRGIQKNSGKEVAIKIVSMRSVSEKALEEHKERIAKLKKQKRDFKKLEAKSEEEITRKAKEKVIKIMQSEIAVMRRIGKIPARKKKNIVGLHDVLVNEHRVCVVMDLLTGGELFDRIVKKKHYSEKDAAFHIRRLMRALRTLHASGIIHRDLKPENFIFENPDENAQIKIADFGLACVVGAPDIHSDSIVGSPGYIAPEVLKEKMYTPACDIWSMGVILYILFVGGPPFYGKSERDLFKSILSGQYRYPSHCKVSALGKDLVSKMLVVDPKKRITISGVLNHPWLLQKAATADFNIAINRLQTFNASRKLKAMTTAVVWGSKSGLRKDLYNLLAGTTKATGFSGEELVLIRDALFKFKPSRTVSQSQFIYAMKDLGFTDLPLEDIYVLFDSTGTDKADIAEICVGLSTAAKSWNGSTQIKYCFETYDRNGNGKLSVNDVSKFMRVVASEMETQFAQRFGAMLEKLKPSPDNVISLEDFNGQIQVDSRVRERLQNKPLAGITTNDDIMGDSEDSEVMDDFFMFDDEDDEEEDAESDDDINNDAKEPATETEQELEETSEKQQQVAPAAKPVKRKSQRQSLLKKVMKSFEK